MPSTGSQFIAEARKFLGVPYVWGGESPRGFDCSGLVQYVAQRLGVRFPRTSEEQWAASDHIHESQLQPGDLIFENWPGEQSPGHVAIYAGGGKIIQAPGAGQKVQIIPWSPALTAQAGGQVVGYGRIPGLSYSGEIAGPGGGSGAAGLPGGGATTAQLTSFLSSPSGVLTDAGALLHGSAVVLDRIFGLFAPGQGWRTAFALTGLLLLYLAWRAFGGTV